ncbi:MAG TPA: hypothetical protein VG318_16880 [Actinomycetota bacterium]|nr:hypothetical protein [Actinomycetota bacterium]
MKRLVALAITMVLAAGVPAGASVADGAAAPAETQGLDNPSEGRRVERGDMAVAVPPRGMTATMELIRTDGTIDVLTVRHGNDGTVHTRHETGEGGHEDESYKETASSTTSPIPACSDSTYRTSSVQVQHNPYFLVNSDVLNATVTTAMMKQAILNAGNNIANARNDCGMPDNVDAPAVSGVGDTPLRTNFYVVNGEHYCDNRDVYSVVELGVLNDAMASTCRLVGTNTELIAADIRFNRAVNWFIGSAPSCATTEYWDMEGTATHEMGHVYGLEHAVDDRYATWSEKTLHKNLTMHNYLPYSARCQTWYRTLGRGDVLGLESRY